ncbi:MAG TPA: hypothetical protein VN516_08890, partial [Candidatus Baltobacteraceae bacterium]|nr:hypothetical protein [Candidatus Baltobacteraceae bacterium]
SVVLKICSRLKVRIREKNIRPKNLERANGVFVSLSSYGIVEAKSLGKKKLKRSPLTAAIASAYQRMLQDGDY